MAGKRTYKAVEINSLRPGALEHMLEDRTVLTVGLDIAKRTQFAALMGRNDELITLIKFDSPHDNSAFVELLTQTDARVQVALESTGSYGEVLRHQLHQAGIEVYQVPTKRAHDAMEIYDGVPSSHDGKSAAVLAWMHNRGCSSPWPPADKHTRTLRAAADRARRVDQAYRRAINQLEPQLAMFWPELTGLLEMTSATLLALLGELGDPQTVARHRERAAAVMRKAGGNFLRDDKIEAVIESAGATQGLEMVDEESLALRELAAEVDRLRRERRASRRRLEHLAGEQEAASRLQPAVGAFSALMLVVLLGDPRQFPSSAAYVKAFGLNLAETSSGQKQGRLHISRRGPGYARMLLFMAAMRLVQTDTVVAAWYQRRLQLNGGIKMKGLVAVMRKLARALWAMAHSGERFDSGQLFDVAKLGLKQATRLQRAGIERTDVDKEAIMT